MIHKLYNISRYTGYIFLIKIILLCNISYASNSTYITLSNQIARKIQLDIAANNIANTNTIGFEADNILFRRVDQKQPLKNPDSFVYVEGTYKSSERGSLQVTNRPTDIAIGGKGYFKILTQRGERYTLNGGLFISSENVIVNAEGLPFASRDGQAIAIPVDTKNLRVGEDGTIYADDEAVDLIGIFDVEDVNLLVKEGNNLYSSNVRDTVLEDVVVISGALRNSNVSSTKALTEMVELQRSVGATNNLMSAIADMERSMINKVAK